jgi:ElaB/YqjD/DUF883 family membrane-anchored ribosome-binding protein
MSDLKDKLNEKIEDAAEATKSVLDKVADQSKDVAHEIGKRVEQVGKRLQDAWTDRFVRGETAKR